jgi:hypothetical protein
VAKEIGLENEVEVVEREYSLAVKETASTSLCRLRMERNGRSWGLVLRLLTLYTALDSKST